MTKLKAIISLLRIKSWSKNLICFAGIIFGGYITEYVYWVLSIKLFISFGFVSSSVYAFNDVIDRKLDAHHPKKKNRPIPSGKITFRTGLIISGISLFLGLLVSLLISPKIFWFLLLYLINNLLYNSLFKKLPIIDVFCISAGFLIRLIAGIYIVGDVPTIWILLCTMFLALFLGFSKRKAELDSIKKDNDYQQRPVLKLYNKKFLDSLVNETALGALICYSLFVTVSSKNPSLVITIPIVYYALAYYRQSLYKHQLGEEPEMVLINDLTIITCIILWLLAYSFLYYTKIDFFSI